MKSLKQYEMLLVEEIDIEVKRIEDFLGKSKISEKNPIKISIDRMRTILNKLKGEEWISELG